MLNPEHFSWIEPGTDALRNGTFEVYVDRWWAVNAEGKVAIYRKVSPQCNGNRSISEGLSKNIPGAVGVELIHVVVLPHRCEEYH